MYTSSPSVSCFSNKSPMISKKSKLYCAQPWAQLQNLHIWPVLRELVAGWGTRCGSPRKSAALGGEGVPQYPPDPRESRKIPWCLEDPFRDSRGWASPQACPNSLRIFSEQGVGVPGGPSGTRCPERLGADSPKSTRHPVPPHKWSPGHHPSPPYLNFSPSCC